MSQEESEYFPKKSENASASGMKRHNADKPPPRRVYEPMTKSVRLKAMLDSHNAKERAFGKELQPNRQESLVKFSFENGKRPGFYHKPNPNERLWNPSPSKRARTGREYNPKVRVVKGGSGGGFVDEENARGAWREGDEDDEKENLTSIYFRNTTNAPAAAVIPYNDNDEQKAPPPPPSSDLNNSFTEKISNLDLGSILNSSTEEPSPSALVTSPPETTSEHQVHTVNWVEALDPDYPYITEILNHWHSLELMHKVSPNYMGKQKEISYKMRTILVDWLVEVVEEYRIGDATLHRCVHFVDRFLSKLQISRGNLQLLGTTCLFIACKVEEIQPPETGDLVYITDNTYDKPQLLKMECLVLSVLDFDLLTPTAYEFTEYFSNALSQTQVAKEFTHYLIELTLLDGEKYLKFKGSVIAMAAAYVAIRCCGDNTPNNDQEPLQQILSRVKRLNKTNDFHKKVEEAVGLLYYTLLSASSTAHNSVTSKYRQFTEQRFLVAAASLAACTPLPWF